MTLPKEPPFGSAWRYGTGGTLTYIAICRGEKYGVGHLWVFLAVGPSGYAKIVDTMMWRHSTGKPMEQWNPA